jgi:hypothetical protein
MRMSIGVFMNWESRPVLGCFVRGFFCGASAWWDVLARLRDDGLVFSLPVRAKLVVAAGLASVMVVEAEYYSGLVNGA